MPRAIGFSTGSLAGADFRSAIDTLRHSKATAIELSALREAELIPLIDSLPSLQLSNYLHVSVHAPSALSIYAEHEIIELLRPAVEARYYVIVHADIINSDKWKTLGDRLCIENMDKRKSTGRTAEEMRPLFQRLPKAKFCLDFAHARQIDPSLSEAVSLMSEFGHRLVQLHVSELNTQSRHEQLSCAAVSAIQRVRGWIPESVPIILEFAAMPIELNGHIALVESILRQQPIRARIVV